MRFVFQAAFRYAVMLAVMHVIGCRDIPVDPFRPVASSGASGTDGETDGLVCPTEMLGFATVAGATQATTGGGAASPVVVTTLADLIAQAARLDPAVIVVSGIIAVPAASQPFQVDVQSDKTILGANPRSGLTGGGLIIDGTQNVIVQNLVVSFPIGTDAITVQAAQHVWIDHCELYSDTDPSHDTSYYGWLTDITHASDFVTVSWTRFHDHYNTAQIGHSDANGAEDMGHLTVTFHHNLFETTQSGLPRVRFGTVHVFNNHYDDVVDYAVASQDGAQVRIEQNVFDAVAEPLTNTHEMTPPGALGDIMNDYSADSGPNALTSAGTPAFTFTDPPYAFMADSTGAVPAIVAACAGPGKI